MDVQEISVFVQLNMPNIKTVVISIPNSNRRIVIDKYLNNQGINFEFLDAAYSKNITRDDYRFIFENYKIGVNSDNSFPDSFKGRGWVNIGEIGCSLSHFLAYRKLLNSEYDCFLILEDDAKPLFTGDELSHFIKNINLNGIDLICCQSTKPSYELKESHKNLLDTIKLPQNDIERNEFTSSGYIVTKSGAKKLACIIEQNGLVFTADNHMWRCAEYSGRNANNGFVFNNIKFHEEEFNWYITTKHIQITLYRETSDATQIHNTDIKHGNQLTNDHYNRTCKEYMSNGISFIYNNVPLDNLL